MPYGAEEHIHNATLRESVYRRDHSSGLPVYFCPKPGFQKRYACYATRFGSIDLAFERAGAGRVDVPAGIAHFLEHKLFEGEECNAFERFSKFGASSNAYTGFTVTNYLFSCSRDFVENLKLLISFVQEPFFTAENVEKEKGIIGQEIQMYDDDPGWQIYMNLMRGLYQKHPVREDIAGTIESISGIDKALLDRCYETFYHPENMILFATGDEDRESFFSLVDAELSKKEFEPLGALDRHLPAEPDAVAAPNTEVAMSVSMPRVLLGFKDHEAGVGGADLLERELATDVLLEMLFGRSAPLYQRLYEAELIDESFGASYTGYLEMGHSLVSGDTPNPAALVGEIEKELDRVRREGIPRADFERQKRAAMGSFFRNFNSLEFIANNYCAYRFCDIDLFDSVDALHELSFERTMERLESHLVSGGMAVSSVVPNG